MILQRLACLLVILQVTFAEPPSGNQVVSQSLLNRVAGIIANGGDGSRSADDGPAEGPSIVDQQLLDRVARIISQNDGQISWEQKAQARSLPLASGEYGATPASPPEAKDIVGPQYELSPPEPVPRIASFDLGNEDEQYSASASTPQDTYADNGNRYSAQNGGGEQFELEAPQNAQRIASFDIEGETPPAPFTPPQARGGFFTNNH